MKIGVIGAGNIANTVAQTFAHIPELEAYAIASRSIEKAKNLALRHGFEKYYGSYEELVRDREVQLVYIASPNSLHAQHMKLCIESGKAVLCEKPFTVNAAQAEEIARLSEGNKVFAAEAIWTMYMPSCTMLCQLVDSGIIGRVYAMSANLWYPVQHLTRVTDPALGGGALLDVGVYCLNLACRVFGKNIVNISAEGVISPAGVDDMVSVVLRYADGKMAMLNAGTVAASDGGCVLYGDSGYISVDNINNPKVITAYDRSHAIVKILTVPKQITGYEYEFLEAVRSIEDGRCSSESAPIETSVYIMQLIDEINKLIRDRSGISYRLLSP